MLSWQELLLGQVRHHPSPPTPLNPHLLIIRQQTSALEQHLLGPFHHLAFHLRHTRTTKHSLKQFVGGLRPSVSSLSCLYCCLYYCLYCCLYYRLYYCCFVQPLFPGESGVDQLVEIIKVLGTPTSRSIKAMNQHYTEFKFPPDQGRTPGTRYATLLCYAVLLCAVLCCSVLYCTVLYCSAQSSTFPLLTLLPWPH